MSAVVGRAAVGVGAGRAGAGRLQPATIATTAAPSESAAPALERPFARRVIIRILCSRSPARSDIAAPASANRRLGLPTSSSRVPYVRTSGSARRTRASQSSSIARRSRRTCHHAERIPGHGDQHELCERQQRGIARALMFQLMAQHERQSLRSRFRVHSGITIVPRSMPRPLGRYPPTPSRCAGDIRRPPAAPKLPEVRSPPTTYRSIADDRMIHPPASALVVVGATCDADTCRIAGRVITTVTGADAFEIVAGALTVDRGRR